MRATCFKIKEACVTDIHYLPDRNLTRDRIARLATCAWVEAREGSGSTMFASQLEPERWRLRINSELSADSMLNRAIEHAITLDIKGPTCASTQSTPRPKRRRGTGTDAGTRAAESRYRLWLLLTLTRYECLGRGVSQIQKMRNDRHP